MLIPLKASDLCAFFTTHNANVALFGELEVGVFGRK